MTVGDQHSCDAPSLATCPSPPCSSSDRVSSDEAVMGRVRTIDQRADEGSSPVRRVGGNGGRFWVLTPAAGGEEEESDVESDYGSPELGPDEEREGTFLFSRPSPLAVGTGGGAWSPWSPRARFAASAWGLVVDGGAEGPTRMREPARGPAGAGWSLVERRRKSCRAAWLRRQASAGRSGGGGGERLFGGDGCRGVRGGSDGSPA